MLVLAASIAAPACASMGSFADALRRIGGRDLTARVRLRFHSDGERTLTCRMARPDVAYLAKVGWVSVPCKDASTGGG